MEAVKLCTVCDLPLINNTDQITVVREKGLKSLIKKSKSKNDNRHKLWENEESMEFHLVCRKRYYLSSDKTPFVRRDKVPTFDEASTSSQQKSLDESMGNSFNLDLCFICGKKTHRGESQTHAFSTNQFLERLLTAGDLRDDEIRKQLQQRLQGVHSLVAVKVRYHKKCLRPFIENSIEEPTIHEEDPDTQNLLNHVYQHIEESGETNFKPSTLKKEMGENRITNRRLYKKLKSRYGDDIRITSGPTIKNPTIYYKNISAEALADDWFEDHESLNEAKEENILKAASEILQSAIKARKYNTESYRASADFLDGVVEDISRLLNYFLSDLLLSKKKNTLHQQTTSSSRSYCCRRHLLAATPRVFSLRKEKKEIIESLENDESLRPCSRVFYDSDSSDERLEEAATKIVMKLSKIDEDNMSMGEIRYKRFVALATESRTEDHLSSLPPTSSALLQHAKRVFYQVQEWMGNNLQPGQWGWKRVNLTMIPIMTTDEVVPQELITKMFCGCSSDCASKRCVCRKGGLRCSNRCRNCNGISCRNPSDISKRQDVEDHNVISETYDDEETSELFHADNVDNPQADGYVIDESNVNFLTPDYEDNENSSDTDDELWQHQQSRQERRYLKIRNVLLNENFDEEKMQPIWNHLDLDRPPTCSWNSLPGEFDTAKFLSCINKIIKELSWHQDILHMEATGLGRLIYRMKSKFRSDKGLKNMEKVNRALLNYLNLSLENEYNYLKESTEINKQITILPSRQMLQYVLVRTQGFAKLMCQVESVASIAATFLKSRIHIGQAWTVSIIAFSIVSRIWLLSRYLVKKCCIWYSIMYPYLAKLKLVGIDWMTLDKASLPLDLTSWLALPWIDQDIESRYSSCNSIFTWIKSQNDEAALDGNIIVNKSEARAVVVEKNHLTGTPNIGEKISRESFHQLQIISNSPQQTKEYKKKKVKLDAIETREDLLLLLKLDAYPGLDKLQWNILRKRINKISKKLEKYPSGSAKHKLLVDRIIRYIQNYAS